MASSTRNDDVVELLDVGQLAHRTDAQGSAAFDYVAAGALLILRADSRCDVGDRKVVGTKTIGTDVDLDTRRTRAPEEDLCNAIGILDPFLDEKLDLFAQLHHVTRSGDRVHQYRLRIRVALLSNRRVRCLRQAPADRAQFLLNFLEGDVWVFLEVERERHIRRTARGTRAHLLDARNGIQCPLDYVRDLGFDLFRSCTGIGRAYGDGGQVYLREAIDAKREEAESAHDRQK